MRSLLVMGINSRRDRTVAVPGNLRRCSLVKITRSYSCFVVKGNRTQNACLVFCAICYACCWSRDTGIPRCPRRMETLRTKIMGPRAQTRDDLVQLPRARSRLQRKWVRSALTALCIRRSMACSSRTDLSNTYPLTSERIGGCLPARWLCSGDRVFQHSTVSVPRSKLG